MRSAKSGPNLWQIWQVFGTLVSPYGANGQMTMTMHNYRPRQFHRTSNGENSSSGYRDMGSASLAATRPAGLWRQYPSSPEGWGVKNRVPYRSVWSIRYVYRYILIDIWYIIWYFTCDCVTKKQPLLFWYSYSKSHDDMRLRSNIPWLRL